jgi:outer membrane protein
MKTFAKTLVTLALLLTAVGNVSATDAPRLSLSLDAATRRALEKNIGLATERGNLDQAVSVVEGARGAYDVLWNANFSWRNNTDPVNSLFSGAQGNALAPENQSVEATTSVTRLLPTGGSVSLFANWGRATTDGVFTILSPAYDTGVGISLRQPLLRGLVIDPAREAIRVAATGREESQARLEEAVSDTVAQVEEAYWSLVAVRRDVVSIESSVELARRQLSETRDRVEMGTLPKTDIAEPTAELERRKGDLALAQRRVEEAENALKLLIFGDPRDPDWDSEIVPADAPETELEHPDLKKALGTGMAKRPEIAEARSRRERAAIEVEGRFNDLLPRLDLVASYQRRGLAGDQNAEAANFNGGPVVVPAPLFGATGRSYGTIAENRFPDASAGLALSFPIGNRAAKASLAVARSRLSQAFVTVRAAEQEVGAEIRNAVVALETAGQRLVAARASRAAAETQLDAEQQRFEAGISTNFLVLTRQNDLTNARVTETSALTDYRQAETELARATGVLLKERHVAIEPTENIHRGQRIR